MKTRLSLLLVTLCLCTTVFAQSPPAFNYQAVVRDAGGIVLSNQTIGLRIAILHGSSTGTIVYQETFTPTTNSIGLMNIDIGTGTVQNGTFGAINWGSGPYYLQTAIDPNGGSAYTTMGTEQLVSVPYALFAKNAFSGNYNDLTNVPTNVSAFINDAGYVTTSNDADADPNNEIQTLSYSAGDLTISGGNTINIPTGGSGGNTLDAAYDQDGAGLGRSITVDAGEVELTTATPGGVGLRVTNTNTGSAIVANNTGAGTTFSAIQATTVSNSANAAAVVGSSSGVAYAVVGQAEALSTAQAGVYGSNLRTNGGHGVHGIGFNGVVGETNYSQGNAVFGENYESAGALGNGIGVAGTGYYGVVGEDRYLGTVAGAFGVYSNGDLGVSGAKAFQIDHPADPENKFLRHFSIESDEVLNIYRGNAVFNENGEAEVVMPDYYELVNRNPTYQLTPVGGAMQLFVKEELADGRFVVGGGTVGMKVSWTIFAERNDPYLQTYPEKRAVVIEKREGQKGKYLMPQLYGQEESRKMLLSVGRVQLTQPRVSIIK